MSVEKQHALIDSVIGRASIIGGSLSFRGGLRVDGRILGNVEAEPADSGYLVLSRSGRIEGNVRVARIVVSGEIFGNLHASGMVELQPGARIQGDVNYCALAMQAGAVVTGKISHQPSLPVHARRPQLKQA